MSNDEVDDKKLSEKLSKINNKLKTRDEPQKKNIEMDYTQSFKKQNHNLGKSMKFYENFEEDFRNFNHYLPKIQLTQNTQFRSTFSKQNNNFEDHIKIISPKFITTENKIRIDDLKFKKFNKNNSFKKDYTFYENKYFEFTFNDSPDKM